MVASHPACPHAAERHPARRQMDNRVIDAASAKAAGAKHLPPGGTAACEQIQSQRLVMAIHVGDHLRDIPERQHRKQWSENFLLHDGIRRTDIGENRRRNPQMLCIHQHRRSG